MEEELKEFLLQDDDLEEANGGTNIKVFSRWVSCAKTAYAICENANKYPPEGKALIRQLYKSISAGNQTETVDLIKEVCSSFPGTTKQILSLDISLSE